MKQPTGSRTQRTDAAVRTDLRVYRLFERLIQLEPSERRVILEGIHDRGVRRAVDDLLATFDLDSNLPLPRPKGASRLRTILDSLFRRH